MTKKDLGNNQVDIYNDFSKYIKPKDNADNKMKRFVMLLPNGMYNNISKLAENEGMGVVTYIRDKLIAPQLQLIANQLKAEYENTNNTENK